MTALCVYRYKPGHVWEPDDERSNFVDFHGDKFARFCGAVSKIDKFSIKNEEFSIKNEEFCIKTDNFAGGEAASYRCTEGCYYGRARYCNRSSE